MPGVLLALLLPALGWRTLSADTLMICHGYGCKHSEPVSLSRADRAALAGLFPAQRDAAAERAAVAQAVAWFERLAGRTTPIHRDRGGNPLSAPRPGQLDCIDESHNTTAMLILLEQRGLLRWHRVGPRVFRAPWVLDQHWAAQLIETASGRRFVVDAWPQDNGQAALVQPLSAWLAKYPSHDADGGDAAD